MFQFSLQSHTGNETGCRPNLHDFPEAQVNDIPADATSVSISTFFQLQEEERYRLAQALMSGPGQVLANALMELEHCLPLIDSKPTLASAGIAALRGEVRDGLAQLKGFVAELQPPLLAEMGLGPSLDRYVKNFGEQNGIKAECVGCRNMRERVPSTIETALFRIVQEALGNVQVHSGATRVRVRLRLDHNQLRLSIEDNGRGFDRKQTTGQKRRQLGLVGMSDLASLVGGQLQIFSEAGKGVRVSVVVPYHAHSERTRPASGGRNGHGNQSERRRKKDESA